MRTAAMDGEGLGSEEGLRSVVRSVWGYDTLRPMQGEAIRASLERRDSLVVMPTGGGKSLCYQVPPLITGKLTVVVSPLIALMQDQVAGLRLSGYSAAALHSHVSPEEARRVRESARDGSLRLLLIAPERLLLDGTVSWMRSLGDRLGSIAVDEAHCISQWGHDFRPEYRRLAELRAHLPGMALHAYTATATPRVREDIVHQLRLEDPLVLVGRFDRPNLTYRVLPRTRVVEQCERALSRHKGEAAIVYCISRRETESLADALRARGIDARAYHAGMDAAARTRVSADFKAERLDVVCATVAFGMGIDRGDVRCVVHAGMPKSVEHYQQETGRAGRDGLPSECILLYSPADSERWRTLMERSASEGGGGDTAALNAQLELLRHMRMVAGSGRCRHAALSEYFGQAYEPPAPTPAPEATGGCGACDVCLNELDEVPGSAVVAQKIISCVYRVGQGFGAAHVADVLRGKATARIIEKGHDRVSTFGLLRSMHRDSIVACVHQLVDAGALAIAPGEFPVVTLTGASKAFLSGERAARLLELPRERGGASADGTSGPGKRGRRAESGVDALDARQRELFESLRALRREIAERLGVPPFVVFADTTLIELAVSRPTTPEAMLEVKGVGRKKLEQFGEAFAGRIAQWAGADG
ncbi:MAG: RecQ family ATP-dependent DNA helicase [Planctomycetes bacterium]|nr:RecQ family ATP-dependent DNA helicase [Planctomycetota bacterium]